MANALASLKFHQARLGFTLHPFDSFQLKLALRSLPFTLRTTAPAAPFPAQLLAPLCAAAAAAALGPWAAPFRALCLLAFFSFGRLASLVPPIRGCLRGFEGSDTGGSRAASRGSQAQIEILEDQAGQRRRFLGPFCPCTGLTLPRRGSHFAASGGQGAWQGRGDPLFAAMGTPGAPVLLLTQVRARVFFGLLPLGTAAPKQCVHISFLPQGGLYLRL